MGEILNLGAEKRKRIESPKDWTATELLNSVSEETFPRGLLVAWIDEAGLVHVRRAHLDEGDEVRLIRTVGRMLVGEKQEVGS